MIKMQVIGNLGRDAAVNVVNGKNVINFPVAHTERFKDAQGVQKDKTIWVDCAYWTDRTAVAPYLKKGTQVYVEGQPDIRTYTNKEGQQAYTMSLRVSSVQLLGTKNENGAPAANNGGYQTQPQQPQANTYSSAPAYVQQPAPAMPAAHDITEPLDDLPF